MRTPPYPCAPPKLRPLKDKAEEPLQKEIIIQPSKSLYVSLDFLIPMSHAGYRREVDYGNFHKKETH